MEQQFIKFLEDFEKEVIPLSKQLNETYFNATISGNEEDFKKFSELNLKLSKIFADKGLFKKLKEIKESDSINDPILKRELDLIYNDFAQHQFDENLLEEIINLSTKVEEKYSTFRASVGDKKLTDNQIEEVLKTSTDSDELEKVWKASKVIGEEVAEDVKKLVALRNKSAKNLGYNNYHEMSLYLSEQDPEELDKLFNELDNSIKDQYAKLKDEIDEKLSERYKTPKDQLMPWHYQDRFFQHGPSIYKIDFDKYYKDKDVVKITRDYYDGLGLEVDDLIEKSDLFEKEGKYQHAYCTDIDRDGDVRVVCNIKPNYSWMGTMLHEFGHAVYDKYESPKLPWTLRQPAHIFTTEAIAMLFGRFAGDPQWLKDVIGISEEDKEEIYSDSKNSQRLEQLVFTRWVQVLYRFEREMYRNPDQDLNKLWWDLVEKYQMIKKPEGRDKPDWASKIHVALYPAYYHNYMLGELLASQLYFYLKDKVVKADGDVSFNKNKDVGEYLRHLYFSYGALYHWSELIKKATGEELTPKYYVEQFV